MAFLPRRSFVVSILLVLFSQTALARAVVDEQYCRVDGLPGSLRQTVIVVDGEIVVPEANGPRAENQAWRRFVAQFMDNADPLLRQRIDARERVTVAVSNADGSGITPFFIGCPPLFRVEEEAGRDAGTSSLEKFMGNDWRSQLKKSGERFKDRATLALVENVRLLPEATGKVKPFRESGLIQAMAKTPLISLENGLPRVIFYTDLDKYQ
ncbi:MAG: hypothetical protein ACK4Z4_01120, partial [Ferrovibrio sp.]